MIDQKCELSWQGELAPAPPLLNNDCETSSVAGQVLLLLVGRRAVTVCCEMLLAASLTFCSRGGMAAARQEAGECENWPSERFALLEFTLAALPRPLSAKESLALTRDDDLDKPNDNNSDRAPCTPMAKSGTSTCYQLLRDGNYQACEIPDIQDSQLRTDSHDRKIFEVPETLLRGLKLIIALLNRSRIARRCN